MRQISTALATMASSIVEGKVVSGPPPKPLDEYENKVEDGNLFIHFVEG